MTILLYLLYPITILYKIVVTCRNYGFDYGIFKSQKFDIPIISVGNLCMGGSGKTPHIEYLIRLLSPHYRIAVLSRGYKRKGSDFIIANQQSTIHQIGDELMQYFIKYPQIIVAADAKRKRGIEKLLQLENPPQVILLDDAYQHRYVKPGLSILLTDYYSPYYEDFVFPFGRLRENRSGKNRADIIVVSKCPSVLSPLDTKIIVEKINPDTRQSIFFSNIQYDDLQLYNKNITVPEKYTHILLFSGIANPYPLEQYLKNTFLQVVPIYYKDHYQFTEKDINHIQNTFDSILSKHKIIVTTEKDLMRLKDERLARIISQMPIFYAPIKIQIHKPDPELFDQKILQYVSENTRNS